MISSLADNRIVHINIHLKKLVVSLGCPKQINDKLNFVSHADVFFLSNYIPYTSKQAYRAELQRFVGEISLSYRLICV
jgi:hypothetical protein